MRTRLMMDTVAPELRNMSVGLTIGTLALMRLNTYRVDPDGYRRLLAWNQHLVDGPLPARLRTVIEIRVSQINGCAFCLAMHTDEARQAGVPQATLDVISAWEDAGVFSEQDRAALALAEAMTRLADGGRIKERVWDAASSCFDQAELAALVQVVALINSFNRINVATERTAEDYYRYAGSRSEEHGGTS